MAKRKRRSKNPLAAYGYPSDSWLQHQAQSLAEAGAPTKRGIYADYGRQLGDVEGFTRALVSLLRGSSKEAGAAFDPALAEQRQVNQAAQDRLSELGPEYANLAGATAEGPLAGLLSRQASQRAYATRQPGIAASAGALQSTGVVNARGEALKQRAEGIRQALPSIFNTLQQQAVSQANANRDFAFQSQQADRSFSEQRRQFNVEQKRLRDQFVADQKASLAKSPYTASQISAFRKEASGEVSKAIAAGVGPQRFIDELIQNGVPREVAAQSAAYGYGRFADRIDRLGNLPQFKSQNPKRAKSYDAYQAWLEQLRRMYGGKRKQRTRRRSGYAGL